MASGMHQQLPSHLRKARVQGATLKAQQGSASGLDCFALPRNSSSASPPPSHKLGQVGNFDVEIANVDVPGDIREVDVLHGRHGPRRGC